MANRFYIHLGMTGRLTVEPADAAVMPHTHLIAELEDDREQLRFRDPRRFGGIFWMGCESCEQAIGPEPLTMRVTELAQRLGRTRRAIKNALLDQRLIAGLGNIYVDESLFDARIHPLTRSHRLTPEQVAQLNRSIKKVLRRALHHRGSTLRDYMDANGKPGGFQRLHKVYDREGQPCPACKRPLMRIIVGGRSTCFCADCQEKGGRGSRRAAALSGKTARQEPRPPMQAPRPPKPRRKTLS